LNEILSDPALVAKIESFALVPADGGKFEFSVNGKMLYSKKETNRHAEPGEVIGLLRAHISEA
jgi:selenoprotein W-related protein